MTITGIEFPMLRFLTCGSVDDGKSTLIGRLLYDAGELFDDQLQTLKTDSARHSNAEGALDFSLLLDGLEAEREQGITIDVAYRYFSTPKRKFIIADTPGHVQYTRNMVTGASTADVGLILIDARQGILPQTKRHAYLLQLLGVKYVVVVINKMDLIDYSEEQFLSISRDFQEFAKDFPFRNIRFIPVSALRGDNVVHESDTMPWYEGKSLLHHLETLWIPECEQCDFRFPVQYVNRPHLDFRGYAGTISAGQVKLGDEVQVLPSGVRSQIKAIHKGFELVQEASIGDAVTLVLTDERDISRGDLIVHPAAAPKQSRNFTAEVAWMAEDALKLNHPYQFKFQHEYILGEFHHVIDETNIETLALEAPQEIALNHIFRTEIRLNKEIPLDIYGTYKETASFIVVDRYTHQTVAAGFVREINVNTAEVKHNYSAFELELNALIRKHFPHWEAKSLI